MTSYATASPQKLFAITGQSAYGPVAVAIGAQRVDSYMPGFGDEPAAERDPCSPVPPATSKKSPEEGRTERSTSA
jgi:hypothetical protein